MKVNRITSYVSAVLLGVATCGTVQAGSVYLTGHDVDFHGNQNNYSGVILNWLRGAGTASEIPAASYDIGVLRTTGVGTFNNPTGFGTVEQRDPSSFGSAADFAAWLATKDVLEIASHVNCGGCSLTTASSNLINDIWANTGANLATYYNFLPPGAVASGSPISGSAGFDATNAGDAIGIAANMINGFETHNRFASFDTDFTVFETRPAAGVNCNAPPFAAGCEIISIGIRDARIGTDDIGTDSGTTVPEPGTLALVALAALGFALRRRSDR
jgi:hypothetical protein